MVTMSRTELSYHRTQIEKSDFNYLGFTKRCESIMEAPPSKVTKWCHVSEWRPNKKAIPASLPNGIGRMNS